MNNINNFCFKMSTRTFLTFSNMFIVHKSSYNLGTLSTTLKQWATMWCSGFTLASCAKGAGYDPRLMQSSTLPHKSTSYYHINTRYKARSLTILGQPEVLISFSVTLGISHCVPRYYISWRGVSPLSQGGFISTRNCDNSQLGGRTACIRRGMGIKPQTLCEGSEREASIPTSQLLLNKYKMQTRNSFIYLTIEIYRNSVNLYIISDPRRLYYTYAPKNIFANYARNIRLN